MNREVELQGWAGLVVVAIMVILSSTAFAVSPEGFIAFGESAGDSRLSANDDSSAGLVTLGTPFIFFGTAKSALHVNNNGNITFDSPLSTFTPFAFPSESEIIAPYFADVDTRGPENIGGDGIDDVFFGERTGASDLTAISAIINAAFGGSFVATNAFVATWDHVGYYSAHTDLLNTFQVVLATDGVDSFVIFHYLDNGMNWETGDASGGSGGFGGTEAAAGFDAGNNTDFFTITGSFQPGIADVLEHGSNVGVPGRFVFQVNESVRADPFPPNIRQVVTGNTVTGLATDSEDVNANGDLDPGEDLNSNGIIDARTEDLNRNGILDPGEDTNSNGIIDTDTGIASIELSADAQNLQLEVDTAFTPGALSAAFTVSKIDPTAGCEGSIRVADAAANITGQAVPFCRVLVGDVDGDGDRDADDARLILEVLVGLDPPAAIHFASAGDLNADGVISSFDSLLILGIVRGRISPPPDNTLIDVVDNGDGTIAINGAPGAVPGDSTVTITNTTNSETVTATAASDGSFSLDMQAAAGENTVVLVVNGGPAKIANTVDVALPDSGIRGLVTDSATGEPVAGLTVLAFDFDSGALISQDITSPLGVYFLEVPSGRYNVVALGTGLLATQWSGDAVNSDASEPVTVASIADNVDFALGAGGAISGRVTGPDEAAVVGQLVVFLDAATGDLVAVDRTEADGSFSRGLAPGHYKVRIDGEASGLATTYFDNAPVWSAATPVEVTLGDITSDVNVQLPQSGRMLGRVTEAETGNSVNDALVIADDIPRGFVTTTRTDENGDYVLSLAPGRYRVRVRAAGTELAPQYHDVVGNLPVSRASTPVTITAGADTTHVDFSLEVGGKIVGQVISAVDGAPLAGVNISAVEFSSGGFVDNTSTRFDGTYELNVPPGDYKLQATATGTNFATLFFGDINERDRSTAVEVASTASGVDFRLPIGGILSGRVTSDGIGVPSLFVCINALSTGFLDCVRSQFDGSYRMALKAPRDYRVYTITSGISSLLDLASDFRFPSPQGRAQEVSLTPGEDASDVDLTLSPGAIIAGQVTATDGTPLPQASVSAVDAETGAFVTNARADFDGTYTIRLPAGSYKIRVDPEGHALPRQWFDTAGNPVYNFDDASEITVDTGDEEIINISIAPGGSISGRLTSLDDGAPVSTAEVAIFGANTGAFQEVRVRADGTYTAFGPPDDYRVEVRPSVDTPLVGEFFNDRLDFGSADLVSITGVGVDSPNIDFVLAAQL